MFDVTGLAQGRRNVCLVVSFFFRHSTRKTSCYILPLRLAHFRLLSPRQGDDGPIQDLAVPSDLKRFVTNITIQITCRVMHTQDSSSSLAFLSLFDLRKGSLILLDTGSLSKILYKKIKWQTCRRFVFIFGHRFQFHP